VYLYVYVSVYVCVLLFLKQLGLRLSTVSRDDYEDSDDDYVPVEFNPSATGSSAIYRRSSISKKNKTAANNNKQSKTIEMGDLDF